MYISSIIKILQFNQTWLSEIKNDRHLHYSTKSRLIKLSTVHGVCTMFIHGIELILSVQFLILQQLNVESLWDWYWTGHFGYAYDLITLFYSPPSDSTPTHKNHLQSSPVSLPALPASSASQHPSSCFVSSFGFVPFWHIALRYHPVSHSSFCRCVDQLLWHWGLFWQSHSTHACPVNGCIKSQINMKECRFMDMRLI